MKTHEANKQIALQECQKMLRRIELFKHIYDFSPMFLDEADKLRKLVNAYENGKSKDAQEVINAFNVFSIRFNKYVESLRDVS